MQKPYIKKYRMNTKSTQISRDNGKIHLGGYWLELKLAQPLWGTLGSTGEI